MSIFRITLTDSNLVLYLKRRNGFLKHKYNTVFIKVHNREEMEDIEKFIISHKLSYSIKNNAKNFNKSLSYKHDCSYNIKNADIASFTKSFHNFMTKFDAEVNKGTFIIYKDYKLITDNSTLISIEINIISNLDIETSKRWFDYYYIKSLNKFLKSKYYVSKKSAVRRDILSKDN